MPLDALPTILLAALAVVVAAVAGAAFGRRRTVGMVAEQLGRPSAGAPSEGATATRELARHAQDLQRDLDLEREDLAQLAGLVGFGIIRLTDDLHIAFANAAAHHFLGREPGWLSGRTAIEGFGDHALEAIARSARDGPSASGEVRLRGPDGPILLARASRSAGGRLWLVLEDVAELRRLQRIRSEFIDNISHELRTPITTVGLLAETLERDASSAGDGLPPRMRERIAKLRAETGNIGQMVDELLDLRRIESGEAPLLLDDVDIGRVARDAVERLRPFAERQGVPMTIEVERDVPSVRGDATRLGQVLTNLLHNAVKFSPEGGTVEVDVRTTGDGRLEISVRDRGIGISRSDLLRIFERFYKADRARVRGGGTGLGLAITRHIVEGHGGQIRAESELGQGSRFIVSLPLAVAARAAEGPWTG